MFADEATIVVHAGDGGNGSAHFRRERFVPYGGPDGGDGGRGGSIYLLGDANLNTLTRFIHERHFRAVRGGDGAGNRRHGAKGRDLLLRVPPGTIVRDAASGGVIADVVASGQRVQVARGGRGGLGNTHFATATNQAPRVADRGEPGQMRTLQFELRLIAEVGLAGLPNAGKSTFLAAVTRAQPKIGNYPFTTLEPNLGVATLGERTIIIADIPGLIEGAHEGVGLGHDFLRHIARTRLLLHLVDGSGQEGRDPLDDVAVIDEELRLHSPELAERPQILVVTKADLPDTAANAERLRTALGASREVVVISAATHDGLTPLLQRVAMVLDQLPPPPVLEPTPVPVEPDITAKVEAPNVVRFAGALMERILAQTDLSERDGVERLRRRLVQERVPALAARAGVSSGEVRLGPTVWQLLDSQLSWLRMDETE
jgi:GTP-binding protein